MLLIFQIENINVTDTIIGQDAIFLPFQVIYDDDIQFFADINDKEGSVNMKKSLAGFFLLKKNVEEEGASVVVEVCTFSFIWLNFSCVYSYWALECETKKIP